MFFLCYINLIFTLCIICLCLLFHRCPYGSFGLNCKQSCPSGYYGWLCRPFCECNATECHHVTGCITTEGTFSPFLIELVFFKIISRLVEIWKQQTFWKHFITSCGYSIYFLIFSIARINCRNLKINKNSNKLYWT